MQDPSPEDIRNALARTYSPRGYVDPTDQLADYEAVQSYCARNPNAGRNKVGNALELPPGRVRGWMEDVKPDAVNAVHTAQAHGWFDWDAPMEDGLATLLVGIYCCGSITKRDYSPSWVPATREGRDRISKVLETLGLVVTERHVESTRPTELVVREYGSILGRLLSVVGAPVGEKAAINVDPLPEWLLETSAATRQACVELYLLERGTIFENRDTISIQTYNRSSAFKESLVGLVKSVVDVRNGTAGTIVTISAEAARELGFGRGGKYRKAIENRECGSRPTNTE